MERRNFLKTGLLAGLGITVASGLSASTERIEKHLYNNKKIKLDKNCNLLFQGDSITDCYRNRTAPKVNDSSSLGVGYVLYAATALLADHPKLNLQIHNRGISGNRSDDLLRRWQPECIDLKPDVLSILIGVNDYLHVFKHNYKGTVVEFRQYYTELMEKTAETLPETQLILGEPFFIHGKEGFPDKWKNLPAYQEVVKEMSEKYNALLVPYQEEFDNLCKNTPASYWSPDSVHPGLAGRYAMAQIWRTHTGI